MAQNTADELASWVILRRHLVVALQEIPRADDSAAIANVLLRCGQDTSAMHKFINNSACAVLAIKAPRFVDQNSTGLQDYGTVVRYLDGKETP